MTDMKQVREALEFYVNAETICVNKPGFAGRLVADYGRKAKQALAILNAIEHRPTDRVSLEKCAKALCRKDHGVGFDEVWRDWGDDFKSDAKTVLDAAGVPYDD